jgi:hypothetical protein
MRTAAATTKAARPRAMPSPRRTGLELRTIGT